MPNIPIQQLPYRAEAPADWLRPVADLYTKYQFELKPKQEALERATALEQLKQLLEQAKFDEDKRKNLAGETQTAAFQTETNNLARDKFDWSKGAPIIAAPGSNVLTRQSPDAGGAGMPPPSSGAMTDSFGQGTPQTPWDYMTQTGLGRGTPTLPPMAAQTAPTAAPSVPGYNVTTFPKEPQPYSLVPGQQRRDPLNNIVASVPLTPSQQHVPGNEGENNANLRQQRGFENTRQQAADASLLKAHSDLMVEYDDLVTQKQAIENNLSDGKVDWALKTTKIKTAARDLIDKRLAKLTERYQSRARAAGFDEQGRRVGPQSGKGRATAGKAAGGRVIKYDATGRRTR